MATATACPTCGSTDHGPGNRRVYDCGGCGMPLDPERDDHVLKGIGVWHTDCANSEERRLMRRYVPEGYRVIRTDTRINTIGSTYTRRGAEKLRARHEPRVPSYHLRIERRTRRWLTWARWEVVAYQNVLEPLDPHAERHLPER